MTLQPPSGILQKTASSALMPSDLVAAPQDDPLEPIADMSGEPFSSGASSVSSLSAPSMTLPVWQLMLLGVSIVVVGLGIGVTTRLLTASLGRSPQVSDPAPPSPSPESAIVNQPTTQPPGNQITRAQFERIMTGMTLAEVETIFGAKGTLLVQNKAGEGEASVYSWKNPQGSNAIIEFRDGKVIAKAEAGLP
ncbi:MAG: hypothetical protein HC919_08650 [Oscillatoriales cyanobacterium SM2_2_1]|nr:hypothetical protein [Oscillatoriales cyanobacterium SM2_2_1]